MVLFDGDRLVYHTLNPSAYAVWQLCDGHRSVKVIAQMLATSGTPLTPEAVELALIDLADAGLLVGVASVADHVSRRQVLKSATAATLGVAMVPVVQSVTAPTSASAQTTCSYSGQCSSNCCANGADIIPTLVLRVVAHNPSPTDLTPSTSRSVANSATSARRSWPRGMLTSARVRRSTRIALVFGRRDVLDKWSIMQIGSPSGKSVPR